MSCTSSLLYLLFLGRKFDSDDEDKASEKSAPGVSDFKDEDDFSTKKSSLPRKPSGGSTSDFKSTSAKTGKSGRPIKKVDLGAAAVFAAKAHEEAQHPHIKTEKTNQMMDLFFSEANPKISQLDHEVDDFNPRANDYTPIQDSVDGDAFTSDPNDGFADFSSAFETNATPAVEDDLFGGFSTIQPRSAGLDLFSGVDLPPPVPSFPVPSLAQQFVSVPAPSNPASSMDLLGGLDFATPSFPPLGAPPIMGVSQPMIGAQPVMGIPGVGLMMGGSGPSSLPLQPASNALPTTQQPSGQQINGNSVHVGSTWQDLGRLDTHRAEQFKMKKNSKHLIAFFNSIQ